MKRTYMTPEAEKIAFNYREQVVAASSLTVGQLYGNETWSPMGTCKYYGAEAAGYAICGLFSAE